MLERICGPGWRSRLPSGRPGLQLAAPVPPAQRRASQYGPTPEPDSSHVGEEEAPSHPRAALSPKPLALEGFSLSVCRAPIPPPRPQPLQALSPLTAQGLMAATAPLGVQVVGVGTWQGLGGSWPPRRGSLPGPRLTYPGEAQPGRGAWFAPRCPPSPWPSSSSATQCHAAALWGSGCLSLRQPGTFAPHLHRQGPTRLQLQTTGSSEMLKIEE